jgi:hypothetical protein
MQRQPEGNVDVVFSVWRFAFAAAFAPHNAYIHITNELPHSLSEGTPCNS